MGMYSEKGYITSVKTNNLGPNCFLMLSKTEGGEDFQGGMWNGERIADLCMLLLAQTAMTGGYPVTVIFEGNGEKYKPVYAVELDGKAGKV